MNAALLAQKAPGLRPALVALGASIGAQRYRPANLISAIAYARRSNERCVP